MNAPAAPDPAVSPRIECRRCGTAFTCEWPELSGAIDCPACETTASLSKEHTQAVASAASERRRRGMPGTHNPKANPPEGTEEALRLKARAFRRDADRLCPNCLYDLEGLCEHWNDVKKCPECSERISPRLVCERWIERARVASFHERIWMLTGIGAGVGMPILLAILMMTIGRLPGMETLLFLGAVGLALLLLVVVYRSACTSLRLHDPLQARTVTGLIALGIALANIAVFLISGYLTLLFLVSLFFRY